MTITLTPTQRLVLQQAVDDHGAVVLDGIDAHPGWNRRHVTAACRLHNLGLGRFGRSGGGLAADFKINEAGRKWLVDNPAKVKR